MLAMYFDFRTYFKVLRLIITDTPSPKRLFVHFFLLFSLTGFAFINTICMFLDRIFFPGYRKTPIKEPVFIVGNARSGTTLFHRLLSGDDQRFVYFRLWEIMFPSLLQKKTIRFMTTVFKKVLPGLYNWIAGWEGRQAKDIKDLRSFGLDKPEEDEFLMIIPFASPVITILFPYLNELTEIIYFDERPEKTKNKIMRFYRECVLRQLNFHGSTKTLVSKNPAFVSKMRGLANEFPDSKFIYLMRNPFETADNYLGKARP